MRKFGIVHSRYWSWALENDLDDFSKTLGAYLLSCDHGNSIGCFKCPKTYISEDLGRPLPGVTKALASLYEGAFLMFCDTSKFIFLPKYMKWNPLQHKNHVKGALNIAESLPSSFLYADKVLECIKELTDDKYFDDESNYKYSALTKGLASPLPAPCQPLATIETETDTERDTEKETDTDKKNPPARKARSGTFKKNKDVKNNGSFEYISTVFFDINKSCDKILSLPKKGKVFNPRAWAQKAVNSSKHPGAIAKVLQGLVFYWETTGDPWGYCTDNLKTFNGNFNEAEAIEIHEKLKSIEPGDKLSSLTTGLLKEIK